MIRGLAASIAGLWLVACGQQATSERSPAGPIGFQYASASNDCAPWDGHAVTVLFADQSGTDSAGIDAGSRPLLRVSVYPRGDAQQHFVWPSDTEQGTATRCLAGAACQSSDRGTVTFEQPPADSIVTGTVDLHFADGSRVSGPFRARWIPRRVLCG